MTVVRLFTLETAREAERPRAQVDLQRAGAEASVCRRSTQRTFISLMSGGVNDKHQRHHGDVFR